MTTGEQRRFGDYTLLRQLGAGGMGVVYEARQTGSGQTVALKLIREAHLASRNDLRRFTQETEAAARLDHPNIVHIRAVGEFDGQPFFSMDLVEGESLYVKIMRGEYVSPAPPGDAAVKLNHQRQEQIAGLLAKIARAVHHAHERGILHRDLKPGNILIDPRGEPHLTDFGLAKILHPLLEEKTFLATTPGNLLGTPNYMAPEQISGGVNTRASDLYALGAILYELLTGRPPFTGTTTLEMLRQIAEQSPVKPCSLEPSIARDLETICLKCLEKDPRHRFVSGEALAEELERWLAGQRIRTQRPSLYRRTREWVGRNRVGAALILSLAVGLAVSLVLLQRVRDQREEIYRDRYQTFEDGQDKVGLLWKDPKTREVTFTARELAIMAERPLRGDAEFATSLFFGASTGAEPSSTAQYYCRWLSLMQEEMERALRAPVVFQLRLFKQFNQDDRALATGGADLMVLSAVNFLNAQRAAPGVTAIAQVEETREVVIFANTNAAVQSLAQLAGKTMVFPDADLAMSTWAKAHLVEAGLRATDFQRCLTLDDQGYETGRLVISSTETLNTVLHNDADAGVAYRNHFERNKHWGLIMLDRFPETPNVLAARAGLAPELIQALNRAILALRTKARFEPQAVHGAGPMVLITNAAFDPLRRAMESARQFDGPVTARK